ncbi:MAG: hypothetical protein J6W41_00185 [Alphaproteobacteria bacterium]|nr:hypothetical protein [Alphaproteobacteria bacterium]
MLNKKEYKLATEKLKAKMSAFDGCYDSSHYTLTELVSIIRAVVPIDDVRAKFIDVEKPVSYASGFCALNSYVIYNLTGGDKYWEYYTISPKHGFYKYVKYLKNKKNGQYLYLGDIQNIPYDLGHPITQEFRCPNAELYTALIENLSRN